MNSADKERLLELKLRVWAHVASDLIDPDPDEKKNQRILFDSQIENNLGRVNKAIRLLKEAGIIEKVPCKDTSIKRYKILQFENAEAFGIIPEFDLHWSNFISEVENNMITENEDPQEVLDINNTEKDTLTSIGYKSFKDFSDAEKIYIYYHQDEFDVYVWKNSNYTGKVYYRKDLLTFRHKMILKCLIELELLHNFPQYVGHYAGYPKEVILPSNKEEFEFKKYAISSIFLKDEIGSIFKVYEEHKNKANLMLDAFNKTNAWVESVGGFDEAIRIIRKQIIEDFRSNNKRFECSMENPTTAPQIKGYSTRFKFINKHLDIFNYEALYGDTALQGEKIIRESPRNYWSSSSELNSPDIKEDFDEQKDEESDIEEEVA